MSYDERKPGQRLAECFIRDILGEQPYIYTNHGIRYQVLGGKYHSNSDTVFIQIDPKHWCYDRSGQLSAPSPLRVIFNGPATIVFWGDKSKTVVKCSKDDVFDPEKGFAMCVIKKIYGDSSYKHMLKHFMPKITDETDSNNADN